MHCDKHFKQQFAALLSHDFQFHLRNKTSYFESSFCGNFSFFGSPKMRCKKIQSSALHSGIPMRCAPLSYGLLHKQKTYTLCTVYILQKQYVQCDSMLFRTLNQSLMGLFSVQCCCEEKRVNERAEPLKWSARKRQKCFSWIDLKQTFPVRVLLPADWSCSSWLGHVIPVDRTHTSEARQETADEQMLPSRGNPAQVHDSTPPDPPGRPLSRTACSSAGQPH